MRACRVNNSSLGIVRAKFSFFRIRAVRGSVPIRALRDRPSPALSLSLQKLLLIFCVDKGNGREGSRRGAKGERQDEEHTGWKNDRTASRLLANSLSCVLL